MMSTSACSGTTRAYLRWAQRLTSPGKSPETGHIKVLFHIKMNDNWNNYFLDGGAYDNEQDVLLYDENVLIVDSVAEIKEDFKVDYTLITLRSVLLL